MPNELILGSRRTGDLIDFDPGTPEVKVTLERTERGISLTVPWSDPASPYARWFLDGSVTFNDERLDPVSVPSRLLFQDSHGAVLLVANWAHGFHANLLGPGSGTVWAQYAVLGVREDLDFTAIDGMRTEISGLRAWLGVTSWRTGFDHRAEHQFEAQSLRVAPLEIGRYRSNSLRFLPDWQVPNDEQDRIVLRDLLFSESRSAESAPWGEHLTAHQAVRDLLTLSRWRQETCVITQVMLGADVLRTLDGTAHGEQWRRVVVSSDDGAAPPSGYRPHLIEYGSIGTDGVARWLQLRDHFARALDPILSSLALVGGSPFTVLAQSGPGLEALGYLLFVEDGLSPRAAAGKSLRDRFDRILFDVGDVLPFDGSIWAEMAVRVYNGLKHANRVAPDEIDLLNVWREGVLIVRAWVALRLGITKDLGRERLAEDPQSNPFVQRA